VDVCSGVERAPGIKDVEKLKRFMENVKEMRQERS
jgi:phosphoribosylanthranilate isomerase